MNKNFKIVVEYDGTHFSGWQRQPGKHTIQGEIETVFSRIMNQKIRIFGSGRTDAGVHAFGQVANFHARTAILPGDLKKGANSLFRHPIVIRDCCIVADEFHAQYNAVSKEYHYYILNRKDPCAIGNMYQWHIRDLLDKDTMQQCCRELIGIFDFKSFENTGSPRTSTVREIFFSTLDPLDDNRLVFKICASGFLKYMVRNIMGTLVLAGKNKITVQDFQSILKARDRSKAGPTAPAYGLFLKQVNYA